MRTSCILSLSFALLLLNPFVALAVDETWDGGGGDDDFSTGDNWLDNSAPVSDLANTNLIFAGGVRLTPNVDMALFSTNSVTFDNAGSFTIGGLTLRVGAGGIVNDDAQTMTFTNLVNFSLVANSTITAAAGRLTFTNTVALPTSTLTVTGGFATNFRNFGGNRTVVKQGGGTMTWSPDASTPKVFASQCSGEIPKPNDPPQAGTDPADLIRLSASFLKFAHVF